MTTTYTVQVSDIGTKRWYLDGKLHRVDGPAVEWADGSKYWFLNDKLHRVDGPAVEGFDGGKSWYLDGKCLTQAQWLEAVKPKLLFYRRTSNASCVGKIVEVDGVKYKLIAA